MEQPTRVLLWTKTEIRRQLQSGEIGGELLYSSGRPFVINCKDHNEAQDKVKKLEMEITKLCQLLT